MPPKGTGPLKPFIKRKTTDKVDCPAKKPKVVTGPTVEETPSSAKLPPLPRHGAGKGLMTIKGPVSEKCRTLLHEDSWYAIGQLLSIIKDYDYENLGNHATEAMGETSLLSLAQVCIRPSLSPVTLLPLFLTLF